MYGRLAALPDQAEPLQRAQLLAALSVGSEIIQLRHMARKPWPAGQLDAALAALAQGNSAIAIARLLSSTAGSPPLPTPAGDGHRAAGARRILVISEALAEHGSYFDCGSAGMRFTEIDLFGVYVAPISLMMVAAWLVTIALRRVAGRFGLLRYVWHPALFVFAVYIIVLSSLILIIAR